MTWSDISLAVNLLPSVCLGLFLVRAVWFLLFEEK